ncbi:sugar transferase [Streptomyces sp. NRRL S-146]|uniref:sugar transferase n=1 Tax=Streptomyces sp. NRRL S-146 TaxID=1463884 RepID=UPI00099D67A9|nr:sugar transferase [Streptomyces sp. NRRL S-146]
MYVYDVNVRPVACDRGCARHRRRHDLMSRTALTDRRPAPPGVRHRAHTRPPHGGSGGSRPAGARRRRLSHAALRAVGLIVIAVGAVVWFLASGPQLRVALFAATITVLLAFLFHGSRRGRMLPARAGRRQAPLILLVGPAGPAAELITRLHRDTPCGLRVVAACLTDPACPDEVTSLGVPVFGIEDVLRTARRCEPDAVLALPHPDLGAEALRELAWSLRGEDVELLLAPALPDVAPARISVTAVAGMPLLRVRVPNLSRVARIPKALSDRILASLGLVLLAPLLVALALLVRLDSPGPAFFRQRRLGLDGRAFTVIKLRTMQRDAEKRKADLIALDSRRDGLYFKVADDPRVTRVGSILRRYSLDELPQLFNVAMGQMSLVGPRPLSAKPSSYTEMMKRRLLVKPGMTGLWQVSGRCNLSREESLRLDLSYVENWSPALDMKILLRTAGAVVRGTGAY